MGSLLCCYRVQCIRSLSVGKLPLKIRKTDPSTILTLSDCSNKLIFIKSLQSSIHGVQNIFSAPFYDPSQLSANIFHLCYTRNRKYYAFITTISHVSFHQSKLFRYKAPHIHFKSKDKFWFIHKIKPNTTLSTPSSFVVRILRYFALKTTSLSLSAMQFLLDTYNSEASALARRNTATLRRRWINF